MTVDSGWLTGNSFLVRFEILQLPQMYEMCIDDWIVRSIIIY